MHRDTYTQLLLPFTTPIYDPKDFIEGPANAKAVACIRTPWQWPQGICVVYGPKGCGKTHLGHVWENLNKTFPITWLTGREVLIHNLILKHPSALILDLGDGFPEGTDDMWMHTLTRWREKKTIVLILARDPPALWPLIIQDVVSRVRSLLAVAIEEPDDMLLHKILPKWFAIRHIHVEPSVINFLISTCERSWSNLQGLVETLTAYSLSQRVPLSLSRVRTLLQNEWRDIC